MSDPTDRLNAALEGRYRVERELGEGGMANVYLADDLKHERRVALKVLKPELAALVGAERFLAEIKVTAGLRHPNILPLFDSGEADSFLFYVMPYVEGESLRDRLDRDHQLPVDEAVRIAVSVANALDHAHRKGVVHRDIKPANIMLQDGEPVVADFGIALAVNAGQGRLTETGLSIGTPFYMSPEQAMGDRTIAPSSDIYSLACVLYELLAGEPPHGGGTAQAVLGKIITSVPVPVGERRPTVPAHVDAALRKALEKIPPDRFATADTFAKALTDASFRYGEQPAVADAHAVARPPRALIFGLVGVTAVAVLTAAWALTQATEAPPQRVLTSELTLGPNAPDHDVRQARISAVGSVIVFAAVDRRNISSLFVRESDELTARPIPNTEGAREFSLSPAGDEVAFTRIALGPLWVVSTSNGSGRIVAERAQGPSAWSDEHIYFQNAEFGISRAPIEGGDAERLTPDLEDPAIRLPTDVLPGNAGLLFTEARQGVGGSDIHLLSLDSRETSFLTQGSRASYVDGFLVYTGRSGDQIMGAAFDLATLEISGNEFTLLSTLPPEAVALGGGAAFTVGPSGDLVYQAGAASTRPRTLAVWVDRSGVPSPIDPDWSLTPRGALTGLDLSHDGTRLAVASRDEDGSLDIWVKDLRGGPAQRMTFDPPTNTRPFWGPNDEEIFYFRDPDGAFVRGDLLAIPSDGSARPREVLTNVGIGDGSWGVDHDWMIFRVGVPARESRDIYGLESGDTEPRELVATPATEQAPSLSPDGRWLLYQSDRSGEHNVYVRPFPGVDDGLVQISRTGGTEPQWARSGREIFFKDADGQMVAAQIDARAALRVTGHEVLFDASPYWSDPASQQYDVAPDDQRFIMLQRASRSSSLIVVWNWLEAVKARFEDGND